MSEHFKFETEEYLKTIVRDLKTSIQRVESLRARLEGAINAEDAEEYGFLMDELSQMLRSHTPNLNKTGRLILKFPGKTQD